MTTLMDQKRGPTASSRQRKAGKMPAVQEELAHEFWKHKSLEDMNAREWEALCDGCGKCCVYTLEDADTGEIYRTDVACRLFDTTTCQCSNYAERKTIVKDCVKLTPKKVPKLDWLPPTCAYRLVGDGKDLFWWHPLVSGDPNTVHTANASAQNKTRPEGRLKVPGLMKRIIQWPEPEEHPPKKRKTAKG